MQIQTILTNAAPRVVQPRNGNPFTLFELFDAQGRTWVAKQDVFNIAQGMIGHPVEIVGREEQKGQYLNRYADLVQLAGAGGGAMQSVLQAQQSATAAGRVQQPQVQVPGFPTDKDRCINRQTAGKVAAAISTTADEFWANIQDIANYFDTGQIPMRNPIGPMQSQIQNQMASVGMTDGYQYQDSDEPPF